MSYLLHPAFGCEGANVGVAAAQSGSLVVFKLLCIDHENLHIRELKRLEYHLKRRVAVRIVAVRDDDDHPTSFCRTQVAGTLNYPVKQCGRTLRRRKTLDGPD